MKNNKKERLQVYAMLFSIITLTICIILAVHIFVSNELENNDLIKHTTDYKIVNLIEAKELISNTNITIIDCRGGCKSCVWKNGYIKGAEWISNPEFFYNTTEDLLVYCQNGKKSESFCQELVNHTYGKLYCLQGGYNNWKK